jgi:hypothetical protein
MNPEDAVRRFFAEIVQAVESANAGHGEHPYRRGTFLVSAVAGETEITLQNVSEEDAILIAAELRSLGAHAVVRGAVHCPHCGAFVPDQEHCTVCRSPLGAAAPPEDQA